MLRIILGGVALAALALPATAAVHVTLEAPGAVNTTVALQKVGVETFDSYTAGTYAALGSNFGGTSGYSGEYSGPVVMTPDQWGGANNTNYVVALGQGASYTLALNKSADYFGFYLAALSSGNNIAFLKGGNVVASYDYNYFNSLIDNSYKGIPPLSTSEKFAFVNFAFDGGDSFDSVRLWNTGSDGFETDNHTVGSMVPEPATWAMLIAGFGLVGLAARRRRLRLQHS